MVLHGVSVALIFAGCYFCYSAFFSVKFRKPLFCLLSCIFVYAISWVALHFNLLPLNASLTFVSALLGLVIVTRSRFFYMLVLYPIVFMLYLSIQIFVSFIFSLISGIPYDSVLHKGTLELTVNLITLAFFFLWYLILGSKRIEEEKSLSVGEYFVLLICSICVFVIVAIAQDFMKGDELVFLRLKAPFAVSITLVSFMLISGLRGMTYLRNRDALNKAERALYNQYLEKQEEHIKDVIEADKRLRSFRHDINAHLSALESCIEEKDYDELQNYIDRMKEETQNRTSKTYTGYAAVDTIVAEWQKKAGDSNISWEWKGKLQDNLKIELFDLCVLFSNLLSNAVEAAEKVENREERTIKIVVGSFQRRTTVVVYNSCLYETMPIKGIRTSKNDKENHGFGLKNIRRIVDKYNGEISISCEKHIFKVDIII